MCVCVCVCVCVHECVCACAQTRAPARERVCTNARTLPRGVKPLNIFNLRTAHDSFSRQQRKGRCSETSDFASVSSPTVLSALLSPSPISTPRADHVLRVFAYNFPSFFIFFARCIGLNSAGKIDAIEL